MGRPEDSYTSDSGVNFKLGSHEAQIQAVKERLDGMDERFNTIDEKLDQLVTFMASSKWSWKAITAIGAALVGAVELIEALKGLVK